MLYRYFTKPDIKETFETENQNSEDIKRANTVQEIEREGSAYKSRLYVLKMFETMFHRKPTHDELGKYSSFGHEKAILNAILNDYDKLENSNVTANFLDNTFGSAMSKEHMSENQKDEDKINKLVHVEEEMDELDLLIPEEEESYEPTVHAMYDKNILKIKLTALQNAYDDLSEYVANQL